MQVKTKLNEQDLREIAKSLNLTIRSVKQGNFIKFTLKHPESVRNKEQFVRKGFFNGQKVHAVCLHGYTAFMVKVLQKNKDAYFRSSMHQSKIDISNINDVYDRLHGQNIGSLINPVFYGWACFCDDSTIEQVDNELYNLKKGA